MASSAFNRKCQVSDELAVIVGNRALKRSDINKKLWKYIKDNDLQDPDNGQYVKPDEVLADIFGPKKFRAIGKGATMQTILSKHIYKDE